MREIVLVISNTSGGLVLFRQELLSTLGKTYEVHVITSDTGRLDNLKEIGCNVHIVPIDRRGMNPVKDSKLMFTYFNIIKRLKPTLVITYTIKPNIYGGISCRWLGVPYAVNITGLGTGFQSAKKKLLIMMYKKALLNARVVFCENKSIRDELISEKIVYDGKIHVLNGAGVNITKFYYQEYPSNKTFSFLFVGRVMREKGIVELITVMDKLISEGHDCKLTIVGHYEEDLSTLVESKSYIDYKGVQPDVRPYIADCDCFVLPSYHEGMANTNLECAASGRPIITSNIPGCRESIIDGQTGYLCEPRDDNSLYQKMKAIMNLSYEDRKKMGIMGREHMIKEFDKRKVVQQTVEQLIK